MNTSGGTRELYPDIPDRTYVEAGIPEYLDASKPNKINNIAQIKILQHTM
jgi:hypothetical protein